MSKTIEIIFEDGVFKPLNKIDIKEHTKIKIVLPTEVGHPPSRESALEGIIDIAEDCFDSDLSIHHDKYLYGKVSK
ncbi:MAG: hypothetical protein SCARUB_00881 [Candidatus Scalindua rubra]|uniref:DUF104 domain-containing protein n=1 Tax=Candidatus Scalindua rubra TaxID=1872076 RepID=A0A1E3XEK1_9BACT|nr:MAG: hypothetical protein SCARUB_00881 [Candidatus Scalindua rubra]